MDVNIWTYYRARTFANKAIHGYAKVKYTMLWEYCDELLRSNPGSTVKVKTNCVRKVPKFERIYICLNACKRRFLEACRPLIGLDGCHLKGNHKEQILIAISIDANNGMYPLAYSVVESECKDTWMWFLELLKVDLKIENDHHITWILDKQKGLEIALNTHFREPEHRHCVRHLYNNFKTQHKCVYLKQLMWAAAKATNEKRSTSA